MKLGLLCAAFAACVLSFSTFAGPMWLGAGTGTPVGWLGADLTNSLGWDIGTFGAGYQPGGSWSGQQVPVITGPTGFASKAVNYPSGVYDLYFNAPNPGAVGVTVGGDMFGLGNVQIVGNQYHATFTLQHDGGDIKAGLGTVNINTTPANPVTGFNVIRPGGMSNPGGFTPHAAPVMNRFQGFMTNKENNSEANLNVLTAADLIPSKQNIGSMGTSYDDLVGRTNANPNSKTLLVSVPLNAQPSYLAGVAASLKKLRPGIQAYVQAGGEDWNALFPTYSALGNKGYADSAHSFVNGDGFGRAAEEYGITTVQMLQEMQKTDPNLKGFLNGQGANSWWSLQAINAAKRNFGDATFHQTIGAMGPSYYLADNLSQSPGTVDGLIAAAEADRARQNGYLADHVALAHANGLHAIVYEASPVGLLTQGVVTLPLLQGFVNDPRAGVLTTEMLGDLDRLLNQQGDGAYFFTEPGGTLDYWGGQGDPYAPPTPITQAVLNFVDGKTASVPEPASLALIVCVALCGACYRPRRPIKTPAAVNDVQ